MSDFGKLGSLKANLAELFERQTSICLWFSGGSDSRLLLEIMLELKKPFGILRFDDGLDRRQRQAIDRIIVERNLQVFSYPPVSLLLIGNESEMSLVSYYSVGGGGQVPIIRDLVGGEKCAFDLKIKVSPQSAPIEFDAHVFGTRFDDAHYSLEKLLKSENWTIGGKRFCAPLADWTREDVIAALKTFGVEYEKPKDALDTGNINCCHSCLLSKEKVFCPKARAEIPPVDWDREKNTRIFRESLEANL